MKTIPSKLLITKKFKRFTKGSENTPEVQDQNHFLIYRFSLQQAATPTTTPIQKSTSKTTTTQQELGVTQNSNLIDFSANWTQNYQKVLAQKKEPSIPVQPSWKEVEVIEFSALNKLTVTEEPQGEEM